MTFWSCRKWLIRMIRLNFEIQGVTTWYTNSCNTHTGQYLTNKDNQTTAFGQVIEYNKRNISLQNLYQKWGKETSSRPLFMEHVQCNMGIFQTSCKWIPYPFLILVAYCIKKKELHFVTVFLYFMFKYYRNRPSSLMH